MAVSRGRLRAASLAGPPSPENARASVPAIVVMVSVRSTACAGSTSTGAKRANATTNGPTPMLRPLPVDWKSSRWSWRATRSSMVAGSTCAPARVWPQPAIEYAEEVGEIDEDDDDPERWLWVACEGSHDGYRDMEWFIDDLDDPRFTDRLARAISGRGAFRLFRDVLSDRPELMTRWFAFSNDRQRGRARSWLATEGYVPPVCNGQTGGRIGGC